MSINQNTKKVIGMYNASNPLINNASKKEIDSILSSYFSSQSATINNSITEIVTEKIEPILSQQSLQLADIRSSLNNIYEKYISDINIEDIDSCMNEQIMNVLNQFNTVRNQCNSYSNKVSMISNYQQGMKKDELIDNALREVDSIIEMVQSRKMETNLKEDNNNNIEFINNVKKKLCEIEKFTKIDNSNDEAEISLYENVVNKAIECIENAKKKFRKEKPNKKFLSLRINENKIDISSIKQYKKRRCYKNQIKSEEIELDNNSNVVNPKFITFSNKKNQFSLGTNNNNTAINQNNQNTQNNESNSEEIAPADNSIASYQNILKFTGSVHELYQNNFINNNNNIMFSGRSLENEPQENKNIIKNNKLLYVTPSFLCPDLFINNKNILFDENGLRSAPDEKKGKFTFFGIDPFPNIEEHQCDILVNLDSSNFQSQNGSRKLPLFYIVYDFKHEHFLLKSLTKEFYFSLIVSPYKQITLDTTSKTYFKIGKIIITITIKKELSTIIIKVRKSEIINESQVYTFNDSKCPINIGRINCDVIIKNESVSKSHVTIDYDKLNERYFLVDNASTNGTQLLIHEGKSVVLEGNMTFNIGNKQFKIEEKNSS